ncbi:MAG: hypothetical protein KGK07_05860 [Chloroflexota bacterium]|nr:hypothetical protein [Chloroflexota bacterium]
MRRWLALAIASCAAMVLLGIHATSAYFTTSVGVTSSFVVRFPVTPDDHATPTPGASPDDGATPLATVTPSATPTHESERTPAASATATMYSVPSVTPTPAECEADDARLVFGADVVRASGDGPLSGTIALRNESTRSSAVYVSLGLRTGGGAGYVDHVSFGNGQVWAVDGRPSYTLYFIGNMTPRASVEVAFVVSMKPSWRSGAAAGAAIDLSVASARCTRESSAQASVVLARIAKSAGIEPGATVTGTPAPSVTPTPTVTGTPAPSVTPTPAATGTPAPSVTPTPTATDAPAPTVTPTATDTPAPTARASVPDSTPAAARPETPTPAADRAPIASAAPTPFRG